MALINCPECDKEVSDRVSMYTNCNKLKSKYEYKLIKFRLKGR